MNEQSLYEQTIAARLEQLPVPDMADAIWLRIKDQLDTDFPEDHQPPQPPSPPRVPRKGWKDLGLLSIVAAIALIYLLNKPKQPSPAPLYTPDTSNHSIPSSIIPHVVKPPKQEQRPGTRSVTIKQLDSLPDRAPEPDHTLPASTPADTLLLPAPAPPVIKAPIIPPVKDSTPPVRKKKGVQGITENDYKIIPTQKQ